METYTVIQDGVDVMTGINTNMATVVGLTSNTNYEFQVKASNSAGDGQPSNPQTLATSSFDFFFHNYIDFKNQWFTEILLCSKYIRLSINYL